jgi:hypothetical protein
LRQQKKEYTFLLATRGMAEPEALFHKGNHWQGDALPIGFSTFYQFDGSQGERFDRSKLCMDVARNAEGGLERALRR